MPAPQKTPRPQTKTTKLVPRSGSMLIKTIGTKIRSRGATKRPRQP